MSLVRKSFRLSDDVSFECYVYLERSENGVESIWFKAKEVASFLGYAVPKKAIYDHVTNEWKKTWLELKEGVISTNISKDLQPGTVFINKKGLAALLQKSKIVNDQRRVRFLAEEFGLDMRMIFRTKEQEFVGFIKRVFAKEMALTQFTIGPYRIDLYFPDLKLAVECDEFGHRHMDSCQEAKREEYIRRQLGCVFYRFDPDSKYFDLAQCVCDLLEMVSRLKRERQTRNRFSNNNLVQSKRVRRLPSCRCLRWLTTRKKCPFYYKKGYSHLI